MFRVSLEQKLHKWADVEEMLGWKVFAVMINQAAGTSDGLASDIMLTITSEEVLICSDMSASSTLLCPLECAA